MYYFYQFSDGIFQRIFKYVQIYFFPDNHNLLKNPMEKKTQKAVILQEYAKKTVIKDAQIPSLSKGEVLIKVQASTINPSDRLFLEGAYFKKDLPTICGFEGTGVVTQAAQDSKSWIGKRVSFLSNKGSWCQYSVASVNSIFQIGDDVPLSSASSGIINPLTVIGFIEQYKEIGCKGGIIHTAAASSLGRMLNKLCQSYKIPLLNIVRRQEHAEILRNEGASHVIVTTGEWVNSYKNILKEVGFDCVFDALGGGPVTEAIIQNLNPKSIYHVYGKLENKSLNLSNPFVMFNKIQLRGFLVFNWWADTKQETQKRVRSSYSELLKNQLKTITYKEFGLTELEQALDLSVKKATQGKILLKIN